MGVDTASGNSRGSPDATLVMTFGVSATSSAISVSTSEVKSHTLAVVSQCRYSMRAR